MRKVPGSSKQGRDGRSSGCNNQEILQRLYEFPFWLVCLFFSLPGYLHSSATFFILFLLIKRELIRTVKN